jgi:hypothetical protein
MTGSPAQSAARAMGVAAVMLALAGCAAQAPPQVAVVAPPPPPADAPPGSIPPQDLVGRWGFVAYHKQADRARTEVAARGLCNQPYVIGPGPTGGIMMHLADQSQPEELRVKGGPGGRDYIGPQGPAADARDREVVSFDGRVLVLRWIDPEVAGRYGTGLYVRCTGRA